MGRERRRFERVESLVDVKYASKSGEINGQSLSKDISENGIGLPVDGKIPAGTKLDVVLILREVKEEITATCKVVWSKKNPEHWKPRYSAGLRFLDMDTPLKDRLLEYARRHKWIKSDFERSLEENRVPILGGRGEFVI